MKNFLRVCLIIIVILVVICWTWFVLTWYKVIPNWFDIEFFNDWLKIDWWESVTYYPLKFDWISRCWSRQTKESQQNTEVSKCKNKCETIEWYWESIFIQRYIEKYWKRPQKNCYKTTVSGNAEDCSYYKFQYPEDFSYNYTWYDEWIHEAFPSDIEKIHDYNNCIQACWPMVEELEGCPLQ